MAHNGKLKRDDGLVLALARGLTVRQAAGEAGFGERTAHRRLDDPEFRRRVSVVKVLSNELRFRECCIVHPLHGVQLPLVRRQGLFRGRGLFRSNGLKLALPLVERNYLVHVLSASFDRTDHIFVVEEQ